MERCRGRIRIPGGILLEGMGDIADHFRCDAKLGRGSSGAKWKA